MTTEELLLTKLHLENALQWFQSHFNDKIVVPIEGQFPAWALPMEVQDVARGADAIARIIRAEPDVGIHLSHLLGKLSHNQPGLALLFKRIVLSYRRHLAVETERWLERTIHLRLAETLEAERKALDALTNSESFVQIPELRLPRLKDFFPVQYVEAMSVGQVQLQPRQFDEKFHILQAPQLFFADVAYFRTRCEDRETPLAVAFVDIDDFKPLNTRHTETKVDRNLLPRFMQTIEAHVFQHGYAYRQGGDEYLILLPSLSRPLAIGFLDELRRKLSALAYPDIEEKTTMSIGLCVVEADCPLTDREILDRANRAKQFAKQHGKNRIAGYGGSRLGDQELEVVAA